MMKTYGACYVPRAVAYIRKITRDRGMVKSWKINENLMGNPQPIP